MSTSSDTQTIENNNTNETKQNTDTEMNDIESNTISTEDNTINKENNDKEIIKNNENNKDKDKETIDIEKDKDKDKDKGNNNSKEEDEDNEDNEEDKEMLDLENENSNNNTNKENKNKKDNNSNKQNNKISIDKISSISKNSLTSEPTEINGYVNPGIVNNTTNIDITQTNLDEPRDARVIKSILKTMGVQAHDPRVVNQLLEFMYKYIFEVLQDSLIYSEHSGKNDIDVSDVRLSIQSRVNYQATTPREILLAIAEEKNKTPLPHIPNRFGVFLPADEYCLTNPNYQINPPKPVPQPVQPLVGNTQRGNYGKKQSEKQIPIKFGNSNTTIVSPPNLGGTSGASSTTTTAPPPILPLGSNIKPPSLTTTANKPTLSMPPTLSSPPTITKTTAPPIIGLGNTKPTTIAPPSLSMPPSLSSTTTTTTTATATNTTTSPPTIPSIGGTSSPATTSKDTKMDDFDDFDSEMKDENTSENTKTASPTASPSKIATTTETPNTPPNNTVPPPDFDPSSKTIKEEEEKTS